MSSWDPEAIGWSGHSEYAFTVAPGGLKVARRWVASDETAPRPRALRGGGRRRPVRDFTRKSRAEMTWAFACIPWSSFERVGMISLTYPPAFPRDGRVVQADLRRFWEQWTRRFGRRPTGIWTREFQRRGAPHFHIYCEFPADKWAMVEFVRSAWSKIAWPDRPAGRWVQTRVEEYEHLVGGQVRLDKIVEYFAGHHSEKGLYQKRLPADFVNAGRWWGRVGRDTAAVREYDGLPPAVYFQLKRALKKIYRSRYGRPWQSPHKGHTLNGLWTLAVDAPEVGMALLRWAYNTESTRAAQ